MKSVGTSTLRLFLKNGEIYVFLTKLIYPMCYRKPKLETMAIETPEQNLA